MLKEERRAALLSEETFLGLLEIEDQIERKQRIAALQLEAKDLGCLKQFEMLHKAYVSDWHQKMRQDGANRIMFSDPPLAGLTCGEWTATDLGVWRYEASGTDMIKQMACSHPIMPTERLVNADSGLEKLRIAYYKDRRWLSLTAERSLIGDRGKIIRLADKGIEVTTENARNLVRYIADVVAENFETIPRTTSIARCGWMEDGSFVPYHAVQYDGDDDFRSLFAAIKPKGDYEHWKLVMRMWRRENRYARIMLAASFASVLLEPLGTLPFVVHLWGGTGAGKTVALMLAMSIWGDPELGKLVRTMNMTSNSIARTAAFLYNIPFAGDELQIIKDRWNKNYDGLVMFTTEGIDRGRAKAYGGVEDTKTWKCVFLFTGEEPITKSSSGGGAKNRCIEIEVEGDDKVVTDGRRMSNFVREHHGYAGQAFVEALEGRDIHKRYQEIYDGIMDKRPDTEGKQAMAAAAILLADEIAAEVIWNDPPMEQGEVLRYLASAKEVDVASRAYDWTINWIARNEGHFSGRADSHLEIWGKIEEDDVVVINRDVLSEALRVEGYDYTAVISKWAQREQIVKDSEGKSTHSTKVSGIKARYVKLKTPPDEGSPCPF